MGPVHPADSLFSGSATAVSRDYRIGLIAGGVLAGIALIWIATRPGLSPQPKAPPISQGNDEMPPGIAQNSTSAPEANQPQPAEAARVPAGPPATSLSDLTAREKTEPANATSTRIHVVRQGETLSAIAQQHYGSTKNWRKILAVNEDTIKDANKIAAGTKLIIP
jgi:nucleoid-associated protein YgaU